MNPQWRGERGEGDRGGYVGGGGGGEGGNMGWPSVKTHCVQTILQ